MAEAKQLKTKAKGKMPTKTSLNLMYQENNKKKDMFSLLVFAIFMILVLIFTKFMVIDKLAEADKAEAQYITLQRQVNELHEQNMEYSQVADSYAHYGVAYLNDEELALQKRADMLAVIDEKVHVDSGISNIKVEDNVATITIESVELGDVSSVVKELEDSDLVNYVMVSTATKNEKTDDDDIVDAKIQVNFYNLETDLEDASESAEDSSEASDTDAGTDD